MTSGLIAILEKPRQDDIHALWLDSSWRYGVHPVADTPYPHFSFCVAEHYAPELRAKLQAWAKQTPAFQVQASGLGLFTGEKPVLYIALARSPALSRLHQALWEISAPYADASQSYYDPQAWMPHITIAHNRLSLPQLAQWVGQLQHHSFDWALTISAIGLLHSQTRFPDYTIALKG